MQDLIARKPALEHELLRVPELGFEPSGAGIVRCLEHGAPWPLGRWHYHDDYELQVITRTDGRAFVGDYIGHYSPGYVALIGPRLPHNWVVTDAPLAAVEDRSRVLHFLDAGLRQGARVFPELSEVMPLLDRAQHGIEFFGVCKPVVERFHRIKRAHGLERLIEFVGLLIELARWQDYRLLSTVQMKCSVEQEPLAKINKVLDYLNDNFAEDVALEDVCALVDMAPASFSRYFARSTGNTLTHFIIRLRVAKACQLLERTDRQIGSIGYEVGFRNLANFNRRFLDVKGVTPTQYRQQAASRSGLDPQP